MSHTPGPWRRGIGNDANRVFDDQGRIIAERTGYKDGHLIAAAPDLLAACEKALLHLALPYPEEEPLERAEVISALIAAKAKATCKPDPDSASEAS